LQRLYTKQNWFGPAGSQIAFVFPKDISMVFPMC
jgi:hypothetical protein